MAEPAKFSRPEDLRNTGHAATQADLAPPLLAWAAQRWPERSDWAIDNWRAPANGGSSQILLFDLAWRQAGRRAHDRIVLHIEPADGPTFPLMSGACASAMELEYRVQDLNARHGGARVPDMIALETDPRWLGRPFYLARFVAGVVPPTFAIMTSDFMTRLSPAQRRRLTRAAIRQIAAVHALDWRKAGAEALLPEGDSHAVRAHMQFWYDGLEQRRGGRSYPVLQNAMAWLLANAPADEALALTWGDCRFGNLMVDPDSCEVKAVLDWEGAAILPADADVGWWLYYDWRNHESEGAVRLPGIPDRDEQLAYYCEVAGRSPANLEYWEIASAAKTLYAILNAANRMVEAGMATHDDCKFVFSNAPMTFLSDRFG